jgi:hypothetical protein
MEPYKSEYTKEEDAALWQLHEIRKLIAEKKMTAERINSAGNQVIKQYKLKNLKVVRKAS